MWKVRRLSSLPVANTPVQYMMYILTGLFPSLGSWPSTIDDFVEFAKHRVAGRVLPLSS